MRQFTFAEWLEHTNANISFLTQCHLCFNGRGYVFTQEDNGKVYVAPCLRCAREGELRLLKKQYRELVADDRMIIDITPTTSSGRIIVSYLP